MNIVHGQVICGCDALELRDALRHCGPLCVSSAALAHYLRLDAEEATELCRKLESAGYLEFDGRHDDVDEYRPTVLGGALCGASAARRVKRETADRHLSSFLDRVREVNDDEDLLFWVERVVLFGSMLTEGDTVGDVDVAVELTAKTEDRSEFRRWSSARSELAQSAGRRFDTITDLVTWPRQEVFLRLKNRSRVLSITTTDDRVLEFCETRVIFERTASNP